MHAKTFIQCLRSLLTVVAVSLAAVGSVYAEQGGGERRASGGQAHERFDSRYGHNQSYPVRGFETARLPPSAYVAQRGGRPYYFDRGAWYRPYRGNYSVVRPPFGLILPILPAFYTTVWFRGIPYFYADETYYLWDPAARGYVVTAPPQDPAAGVTTAPAVDQPIVYPKNGQTEAQQATDRYECHNWARQQSGFDPTEVQGGVDAQQVAARRSQYQRAEQACLESRGYTVR
jgi:hypothetical protein